MWPALRRTLWLALALYVLAWGYRIYSRKYYIWLGDYIRWTLRQPESGTRPVHVLFFFTDHFEPGQYVERARRWERDYPRLADRHRDSSGRPVQHTWFYPGDDLIDENLEILQRLVARGYGEVELHLHHAADDYESAQRKYVEAIAYFQKFGFLKTIDGRTRFGFAHGMNALDNSGEPRLCGVNRELSLLRDLGCFADFTFTTVWDQAQPRIVNRFIQATDDDRPKSYDNGTPLRLSSEPRGDLLLIQGPLVFSPTWNPRRLFVFLENGDVHSTVPLTERRVDAWIRANVHVDGRPDWVFVKVCGHGASSDAENEEMLDSRFDRALSYLEGRYNDGTNYILHYVTAREAYNLALAAAAGERGDPARYLDFVIPPYVADGHPEDKSLAVSAEAGR